MNLEQRAQSLAEEFLSQPLVPLSDGSWGVDPRMIAAQKELAKEITGLARDWGRVERREPLERLRRLLVDTIAESEVSRLLTLDTAIDQELAELSPNPRHQFAQSDPTISNEKNVSDPQGEA